MAATFVGSRVRDWDRVILQLLRAGHDDQIQLCGLLCGVVAKEDARLRRSWRWPSGAFDSDACNLCIAIRATKGSLSQSDLLGGQTEFSTGRYDRCDRSLVVTER